MDRRRDRLPRGSVHLSGRRQRARIVDTGIGTTLQVGDNNLLVNLEVPENVGAADVPNVDIPKASTDSQSVGHSRDSFAANTDIVLKGKNAKAQFGTDNRAVITRKTDKEVQKSPSTQASTQPDVESGTGFSTASAVNSPSVQINIPENHSHLTESQQILTKQQHQHEAKRSLKPALDLNIPSDVHSNTQNTVQRTSSSRQNVGVNTESIPVITRETQTADSHEDQNKSSDEINFQAIRGHYLTQIGQNNTIVDIQLNKEFLEEARGGGEVTVTTMGGQIATLTWAGVAETVASLKSSWTLRVEEMKNMKRDLLRLLSHELFSPLRKMVSDVVDKYQARLMEICSGSLVFVFWHKDEASAKRMVDDREGVREVFHQLMISIGKGNVDFSLEENLINPSHSKMNLHTNTAGPAESSNIDVEGPSRTSTGLMQSMKGDFQRLQREITKEMMITRKDVERSMNETKKMRAIMAIMIHKMGLSKSGFVPSEENLSLLAGSLLKDAPSIYQKEDFLPYFSADHEPLPESEDAKRMIEAMTKTSLNSISSEEPLSESDKKTLTGANDGTNEAFQRGVEQKEPCPDVVASKDTPLAESPFEISAKSNPQGATETNKGITTAETVPSVRHSRSRKFFEEAERLLSFLNISDIGQSSTDKEVKRLVNAVAEALVDDDSPPPRAKTMDTLLCLDISESIGAAGLDDVKRIAINFVDGIQEIAEQHGLEENLGVIALGGRAKIVQQLTNDYGCVRDSIERLEYGGRSPFLEALSVCVAAIKGRGGVLSVGGAHSIRPRIIFVTDGLATNDAFDTGPDTSSTDHNTKIRVIRLVTEFSPKENRSTPNPIIWIPVGNADTHFLSSLAKLGGGNVIEGKDVTKLCSYYRIQDTIGKIYICVGNNKGDWTNQPETLEAMANALVGDLQPEEKREVVKAVQDKLTHKEVKSPDSDPNNFDDIHEVKNLPPIGTRVIRGPDWTYGNQDDGEPGTVIHHAKDQHYLWVMWDFSSTVCRYRYGLGDNYDVMIVEDQPRVLKQDELIEIGVKVRRGPDWSYGDRDGGPDNIGVVIRKRSDGKVKVRWPNGSMLSCRYGYDGKFDIEICPDSQSLFNNTSGHAKPTEEKPHVLWQWLDDRGQWRLYDRAHIDKLNTEFEKRPCGSCLLQKRGKAHRVMFREPMSDKSIEDGTRREVKRLVVGDEERDELICKEMSIDDGSSWAR